MTDLELVEDWRKRAGSQANEETRRVLTLAETGALLAELERRYGDYQIVSTKLDDGGNEVGVRAPGATKKERYRWHEARTLTAALRNLLGVDGG